MRTEGLNAASEKLSKSEMHKAVCEALKEIYIQKNADYGNSFSEQYQEHGLLSSVIRLDDKMRRLKQLVHSEAQVKEESVKDTLIDLANYAIMTVMEMKDSKK